jgi:hypothetical protein
MDIGQHNGRVQSTNQYATASNGSVGQSPGHVPKKSRNSFSLFSLKGAIAVLLVGIAVVVAVLILYIATGHFYNEGSYVDKSQYQAVFINVNGSSGGQAYFGNITSINSRYIILNNAFYLETGTGANQYTLNNLSCALYNPVDQMVINRSQVAFWQNLKSNSTVTQDINKWNTDKLQCSKSTSGANATGAPSTSTTPANTTPATTTPAKP